jgi:PEP-CTERM motif
MNLSVKLLATAASVVLFTIASPASASSCTGNCGTAGANGVVTAPPSGDATYGYVTTYAGQTGAGQIAGVGGTNGSEFVTDAFTATTGDLLNFYFNYVTTDGSGEYTDYAFAQLQTADGDNVAYMFTARTTPTGDTSPGFGLPANAATLSPSTSPIIAGAPSWFALGPNADGSGSCYSIGPGCGYTGWIGSSYTMAATGMFRLRFGVSNFGDINQQSALAFNRLTVAGNEVPTTTNSAIPEPTTWAMMIAGFGLIGAGMRRRSITVRSAIA